MVWPEQAAIYYRRMIVIFLEHNITPIIHLIHEASLARDRDYVREFNGSLTQLALEKNLKFIPNMKELSFLISSEDVSNNLDYRCESE